MKYANRRPVGAANGHSETANVPVSTARAWSGCATAASQSVPSIRK